MKEKEVVLAEKDQENPTKLPDEKLKKVTGGGFDDVPRVPEYPIDDESKEKF